MVTTAPPTWKATTAGVLNIVAGCLSGLGALGIIIVIILFDTLSPWIMETMPPADVPFVMPILMPILVFVLVFYTVAAVFPIIGGIYALQRRHWGWALAGSIITIFRMFILGVLATIFVAMAKDEFE